MNMLIISNMYPNNKYPNYGVFVKNFEKQLEDENIIVDKITLTKSVNFFIKIIKYIVFYCKILIKCTTKEYSIIYVHYPSHCAIPLILASKFKKLNIYANVHGTDILPINKKQDNFQKYLLKLLLLSNQIIVPSNYYKNVINKKYGISDKVFISPSGGISKEKFYYIENKSTLINAFKIDNKGKVVIGYVGRIDPNKGWDIFIEAINELKVNGKIDNVIVIIVGNGSELMEMKMKIKNFNLEENIIYFDFFPQEKLNNIYNILDVLCFPSYSESLGLVGLEAMACGVPVIASDIEALKEYVKNDINGYLFETGNYKSLSTCLNKFINSYDYEKKQKFREECIETVKKYEEKKIKEDLLEILKIKSVKPL